MNQAASPGIEFWTYAPQHMNEQMLGLQWHVAIVPSSWFPFFYSPPLTPKA